MGCGFDIGFSIKQMWLRPTRSGVKGQGGARVCTCRSGSPSSILPNALKHGCGAQAGMGGSAKIGQGRES